MKMTLLRFFKSWKIFFSIFQSLNFFHDLGISVSHASLQRKTKELGKQQEHRFQSLLSTCIEEVKCPQSVEKAAEEQTATKTDKRFRPMELLVNNFGKNILLSLILLVYSISQVSIFSSVWDTWANRTLYNIWNDVYVHFNINTTCTGRHFYFLI